MKRLLTLFVSLLGLLTLGLLPVYAQQPPPYVNVVDYGATPDNNVDDDSDDIEEAIAAACSATGNYCRAVFFPKGEYVITDTINIGYTHHCVKLFGTGHRRSGSTSIRPTQISWNGVAGGVMVEAYGVNGLRVEDICFNGDYGCDGSYKAGKGFDVRYVAGYPSAEFHFQRVALERCTTGFECRNEVCNSDMTFIDLTMSRCNTGFHTLGGQNVNYVFIRPECIYDTSTANTIGMNFEAGGSVVIDGYSCGQLATAIKIAAGDVNNGNFLINGWKPETYTVDGKRMQLLDASGSNCVVQVNNLCTGTNSASTDLNTPLFKLGKKTSLQVNGSQIYGVRIADIGDTTNTSWITFDTCQFGYGDPRNGSVITHDQYSGYELRNCALGGGIIPTFRHDHAVAATPLQPSGLVATDGAAGVINLNWTDGSDNETGFRVYRSTDGATWNQYREVGANVTTYAWGGLSTGTTYYFYVVAKNGIALSVGSNVVSRVAP